MPVNPDLIALLVAMSPTTKLTFARWCHHDAEVPESAHQPQVGSPEEAAAIKALESNVEDLGNPLTPEIHYFFDPLIGEWPAWYAARSAVAALARAMCATGGELGDLAVVWTQLQVLSGLVDQP